MTNIDATAGTMAAAGPDTATDTIVAPATAPGRGGVGIVRLSGPAVPEIAAAVLGRLPAPRLATLARFTGADGEPIDSGIALYFPAPASLTGEHVLELQGHGGPVVMDALVERACALGARPAEPGEFSRRAFLNDKLDLAQAEAVADLVASGSRAAARAAMRSLEGEFSAAVERLVESLTQLRMHVEAAIDFPEEEIDFLADELLRDRIDAVQNELDALVSRAAVGRVLRDGYEVVIVGRPNAGKSSLMNALAGAPSAIVTEVPGTTRDLVRETVNLDGLVVRLTDTAGLREKAGPVEREGIRRARESVLRADHALVVVDATGPSTDIEALTAQLPDDTTRIIVRNKIDLTGEPAALDTTGSPATVALSARTGAGLDALREHLKDAAGYRADAGGSYSARRRHLEALDRVGAHFRAGRLALERERAGELMAEELRQAQRALGEIIGEVTSDDLLGRIFATFCIGK